MHISSTHNAVHSCGEDAQFVPWMLCKIFSFFQFFVLISFQSGIVCLLACLFLVNFMVSIVQLRHWFLFFRFVFLCSFFMPFWSLVDAPNVPRADFWHSQIAQKTNIVILQILGDERNNSNNNKENVRSANDEYGTHRRPIPSWFQFSHIFFNCVIDFCIVLQMYCSFCQKQNKQLYIGSVPIYSRWM